MPMSDSKKTRKSRPIGRPPRTKIENNSTAFPVLAEQWDTERNNGLKFDDVPYNSQERVWWKCPIADDHVWQTTLVQRTRLNTGCPFCLKQRPSSTNNLALFHPEVCKELHPTLNGDFDPTKVSPRSGKSAWWQCKKDPSHIWQANIGNRTAKKSRGCRVGRRPRPTARKFSPS